MMTVISFVREQMNSSTQIKPSNVVMIVIGVTGAISVICISIVYRKDCPAEPFVSVFLLVGGICFPLVYLIRFFGNFVPEEKNVLRMIYLVTFGTVTGFLIVWLIIGSYWVYRIFVPNYKDKNAKSYCHPVIHVTASLLVLVIWILIVIAYVEAKCCKLRPVQPKIKRYKSEEL